MAKVVKKVRVAGNPQKRRKPAKAKNPLFIAGPVNPQRGKKKMAKAKPAGKKPAAKKRNGSVSRPKAKAKTPKRRNGMKHAPKRRNGLRPSQIAGRTTSIVTDGATALVGSVFARMAPQMVLKDKNSGYLGYAANVIATLIASYVTAKFLGRRAGQVAGIGGGLYLVHRMLTEKVSPIGQYLDATGLGDASAAMSLGAIEDTQGFFYPQTYDENGQLVLPAAVDQAIQRALPPPITPAPALAGLPSTFDSRF